MPCYEVLGLHIELPWSLSLPHSTQPADFQITLGPAEAVPSEPDGEPLVMRRQGSALELVLGIDNIIFISILAGRLPPDKRDKARRIGIAMAAISRLGLLLAEIGRSNNIQVAPDEMMRAMRAEAGRYPGQEQQVMEFFRKNPQAAENVRSPIFEEKVVDFMLELAKVTERTVGPDELATAVAA